MGERILSEFDSFESAELAARRILHHTKDIRRISIYPRRETVFHNSPRNTALSSFNSTVYASAGSPGMNLPPRTEISADYGYYEPGETKEMLLVADVSGDKARDIPGILHNAGGRKINSIPI